MIRRPLIRQLFAEHAAVLQAFFRGRLRSRQEAADLTQEVYLRLLRTQVSEIRNPEAYLFTVANNLVKERFVMCHRAQEWVDLSHPLAVEALEDRALTSAEDPGHRVDIEAQARALRTVLPELSPRCQLVLALTYEQDLSQQEIADRLQVSKTMVRKLLSQALGHCRKRLLALEGV